MTWRDRGSRALKHAAMNEGASAAAPGPVTAYYSSPGGAGDYAEADSVVAARVVFPGAAAPVCTVLAWAKGFNGGDCMRADNALQFAALRPGLVDFIVGVRSSDEAVEIEPSVDFDPGAAEWSSVAAVFDGSAVTPYGDGVAGTPGPIVGGGWVAADVFQALVASAAGDIRNILIIDRALSANEIADLYAAGPTHHPLNAAGTHWAAGQSIPVIWCTPAVGGVVANSGDGGACGLVLHGDVASLLDP